MIGAIRQEANREADDDDDQEMALADSYVVRELL